MVLKRVLVVLSILVNLLFISVLVSLTKNRSINFSQLLKEEEFIKDMTSEIFSPELEEEPEVIGEKTGEDSSFEEQDVKVTRVIDGDTIVIEGGEVVRYIGIDTPENPQSKNVECFAKESFEINRELVEGKLIRLEKDVSERDRYNRLLRYVFVKDSSAGSKQVFVNDYLVREGYATSASYPPDIKYQEQFREAEREARENNRGLWSMCENISGS